MASKTAICNMALGHLGGTATLSDVDTESSTNARTCRLYFDTCRDTVLESFPWPFATRRGSLALVETNPTTTWGYSYRYPSDALGLWLIDSGIRPDSRASQVVYRVFSDTTGKLIYTSASSTAEAEWTVQITDTEQFSATFTLALSHLLASKIAPRVTGGDQFNLGQKSFQQYLWTIEAAKANAAREEQPDIEPDSDFVTERG